MDLITRNPLEIMDIGIWCFVRGLGVHTTYRLIKVIPFALMRIFRSCHYIHIKPLNR